MNDSIKTYKAKAKRWIQAGDCLEVIYLILFAAFIMKKYLETTALEWELPYWYDTVLRGGIHAYILVRIYEQAVVKKAISWKETALMAVMIFTGEMVTLYTGEIIISDTLLFIIGAKGVDFKKICFVYICIAITINLTALYLVNGGYVPDYVYNNERGVRHSLGICYPTDFAAHILLICIAYICFREKRLTFTEITAMFVLSLVVYKYTCARNNFIFMIGLCVLCLIAKILQLKNICITNWKKLSLLSLVFVVLFLISFFMMVNYENSELIQSVNNSTANRVYYSWSAYEQYGLKPFGSVIAESGLGYGRTTSDGYFFLDSSYIRILLKYGYIFMTLIITMYIGIFSKARKNGNVYIIIGLVVAAFCGMMEHHLFDIAYNILWVLMFADIKNNRNIKENSYEKVVE